MSVWQSTGFGAIDTSDHETYSNGSSVSIVVLPTQPTPPLLLNHAASRVWASGLQAESNLNTLSDADYQMVSEFESAAIACHGHASIPLLVSKPKLDSIEHELVYALVANLCNQHSINYVFLKGPIQHEYGLRERKHSADVDVWIDPARIPDFIKYIEPWGWSADSERWLNSHFNHSITLNVSDWGCQIDVHRYFPGTALSPSEAFDTVLKWRAEIIYAGFGVKVLNLPAAAVFYALHGLRPESRHFKSTMSLDGAVAALRIGGPDTVIFSTDFHSNNVLHDALAAAFPERTLVRDEKTPLDWAWRSESNWIKAYVLIFRSLAPNDWLNFVKDILRTTTPSAMSAKNRAHGLERAILRVVPTSTRRKVLHALEKLIHRQKSD